MDELHFYFFTIFDSYIVLIEHDYINNKKNNNIHKCCTNIPQALKELERT